MSVRSEVNMISANLIKRIALLREINLLLIIIFISVILSVIKPVFISPDNILSTFIGMSTDGIITVGMAIAIVSGGFDLSVGSVMALSGVTAGTLYLGGLNIWIACLAGILIGMFCGFINGFFIGKIGINPLIITLGMMGMARGAAYVLTEGSPLSLYGVPKSFEWFGQGRIACIPIIVIIFIFITIFGDFILRRSEPLRKVFYTGSNEKAAILSGINTSRVKMGVFVLTATLAALAGILSMARFTVATPTAGVNAELRSISAAVIGGASLSGGEGTVFGAVLGVILLNLINNALVLLNVPVYWQDFVNGFILIGAVTMDFYSHNKKSGKYKVIMH